MRILNICTLVPFPPVDGGRINVYYPIKYLAARGHNITLACLSETMEPDSVRHMESLCRIEIQQWSKKPSIAGAFCSLFSSEPYDIKRYKSPQLMSRVRELARSGRFDVVEAGLHSAWYALALKREFGLPVVLRVHNVHWMNFKRLVGLRNNPLAKLFLLNETAKLRGEELRVARSVDLNLTVTDNDAEVLHKYDRTILTMTVPGGVELSDFVENRPVQRPHSVLWMGSLGWLPNQDSFWWLYESIVPEIVRLDPRVQITVIGSNPPAKIMAVRHPNIKILGYVKDIKEIITESQVCVVPLRIGSGMRLKLLELFAMRSAVVSTSVGCEGLDTIAGEHLIVANKPEEFAAGVVRLLRDEPLRERLGIRAQEHVSQRYNWDAIASQYEHAYESVRHNHS
jgi:polysaccharide biosynthesis protein PslH